MDEKVFLQLSQDEALVFFDFLSRYSEEDKLTIMDQAEQRILWNLTCDLEKILVAPFQDDYDKQLEKARAMVRDVVE